MANPQQGAHPQLSQRLLVQDFYVDAILSQRQASVGKAGRIEDIRRLRGKIAGQSDAVGNLGAPCKGPLGGRRSRAHDRHSVQRWLFLGFLAGLVLVEAVCLQGRTEGELRRRLRQRRFPTLERIDRDASGFLAPAKKVRHQSAANPPHCCAVQLGKITQSQQNETGDRQAMGDRNRQDFVALALETRVRLNCARYQPIGQPIHFHGGRAQLAISQDRDDERSGFGYGGFSKADLHSVDPSVGTVLPAMRFLDDGPRNSGAGHGPILRGAGRSLSGGDHNGECEAAFEGASVGYSAEP